MAIYSKMETLSRSEMENLQNERLRDVVKRVYENVPFYKKKFDELNLKPEDIKSIKDLPKLPFTEKQDLRDNYPLGLTTVPKKDLVRIHGSSGTTGKPTVVAYTEKDIDMWADVMARAFAATGANDESTVQVGYGYGLFTGGLGAHYGAEKLGATVVPISSGNTKRQIMLLQDFQSEVLACTPSYALYIGDEMEKSGIPLSSINLKAGLFGAEPWSESMRKEIEKKLGIVALDVYGLSEIIGPGVSAECLQKCGNHIQEDHFLPEIIDPDTLEPLPYGEQGELVFTTITKEGMPLIRYRTHDIATLYPEPCECGRTTVRMSKVCGRTDDMLIIRGINVFPSQIEEVLLSMGSDIEPHYQIIVTRESELDRLEIQVEMSEKLFSDEVKHVQEVKQRLQHDILSILNIKADIKLVDPRSIPRSEGKAKRVIDLRKI